MNSTRISGNTGFTLIETMITLLVSSFLMGAVFLAYQSQQKTYLVQEQVTEMQQNLRAAMSTMLTEIRLAGYDPTCESKAGITNAQAGRLIFTIDRDMDGSTAFPGAETVALGFSLAANDVNSDGIVDDLNGNGIVRDDVANLGRKTGVAAVPGYQPIAENISAIEFCYTLADGSPRTTDPLAAAPPGQLRDIRTIEISILARSERQDPKLGGIRNYTTACGANWGPFNDRFRRRLLISSVQCRNMGLCQ